MSLKAWLEQKMRYPGRWFIGIAVGMLAADQLLKQVQRVFIPLGKTITVIPGLFYLRSIQNYGAAFSILRGQMQIFYVVAVLMAAFLIFFWLYEHPRTPLPVISTALIAAGGVGNLIDRLLFGAVYDLINVTFFPFAIFNIADMCMTFGVIVFGVWFIFFDGLSELSSKKLGDGEDAATGAEEGKRRRARRPRRASCSEQDNPEVGVGTIESDERL